VSAAADRPPIDPAADRGGRSRRPIAAAADPAADHRVRFQGEP
jgi:hypothetical protein